MKAIAPHRALPPEDTIHRSRNTNRQRGHAMRQRVAIVGLDHQVHMIALHRVVDEPEVRE